MKKNEIRMTGSLGEMENSHPTSFVRITQFLISKNSNSAGDFQVEADIHIGSTFPIRRSTL
jgi:hypothetical protein